MQKPDEWYLQVLPAGGACFAYGFTGCPICDASWGIWGDAQASFDQPGQVTCKQGHTLPDAAHPDAGTGYVGPDQRIHYFVGSYNAWVVETLTFKALEHLALAYSLTGEERYAAKAALILDALAAIYPSCDKGSWDYPSHPPSGRLDRPWYQVARVLVHFVDQYDQVYGSPALDAPSSKPGLTRRQNIEVNLLKNGAAYCYKQSQAGALHNGEADYLRGALAVGVCLGMPEYVRWAVDGPFGIRSMLANNVDRNGLYYETSALYAEHSRELYLTFAEPLLNYRGAAYPNGVNLYEDARFRGLLCLHNLSLDCAGHSPRFGDSGADVSKLTAPTRPFNRADFNLLEYLYARAEAPQEQHRLAALLNWLAMGAVDKERAVATDKTWLLFHARAMPAEAEALAADFQEKLTGSALFGQKGIGILRQGAGSDAQALLMRFGPSLNHGHCDDLNLNYFACGYELTYDLGYSLGSTHTQVGWARQSASHNLVVVNERSQGQGGGGSGGSLHLFADLPGLKLLEASSESSYAGQGVTLYRRTVALIQTPAGGYALDLFRVKGGQQHDYLFHALAGQADLTGVVLGPAEPGSLAGTNLAWGSQQLNDGDLTGHPNQPYWNPPPGNGYGFLVELHHGRPAGQWSAEWFVDPTNRIRLTMAAQPGTEVISALAPGLYPRSPKARYVVARRQGTNLLSTFAAVLEPGEQPGLVQKVEQLAVTGDGSEVPAVAVKVTRRDEAWDLVYSSADSIERRVAGFRVAGRFIQAQVKQGKLLSLSLVGAKRFSGLGWEAKLERDCWGGAVTAADYERGTFTTTAQLPADGSLNGQVILFSNPRYSRTTAYRLARVEAMGDQTRLWLAGSMSLGLGLVGTVKDEHTFTSVVPHEYARTVLPCRDSGFFRGKRIRAASGASAQITTAHYAEPMLLTVDSTKGLKAGDTFVYDDVQPGDQFTLLTTASLVQTTAGHYQLQSHGSASITPPASNSVSAHSK